MNTIYTNTDYIANTNRCSAQRRAIEVLRPAREARAAAAGEAYGINVMSSQ